MGGPGGPDLTNVGAKPEHTKEWLAEHIRQPTKHTQGSKMPPFPPEKISDADLDKLATYLASRKPDAGGKPDDKKDNKKDNKKDGM
jgi:mono/diheme cytochrome c family protein